VSNPDGELTLHTLWEDLSAVLSRRKALVILVAITMVAAVYAGLLFVNDKFEAKASLLVRIGRENVEVPVTVEKGSIFPTGIRKEEINSYIALLISRPLIEATVQEVGLERFRGVPPRPQSFLGWVKHGLRTSYRWGKQQLDELQILLALKRRLGEEELAYLALERNMRVEREKDADVIHLSLRLPDALLARDVLQVLTRKYLARHIEVMRGDRSVLQVFEQQTHSYGDSLMSLREKASRLRSELGVSAVAEQKLHQLEMLRAAELGRQDAERERSRIEAEMRSLLQRRPELEELQLTAKSLTPSVARAANRQSLAELHIEKTLALERYQPEADPVRSIQSRIASLESALQETPSEEDGTRTFSRNPILVFVETRLAENEIKARALEAFVEKTESQIEQMKSELTRLDQAEAELQQVQIEISVAEARFLANASRREEARSQEILDGWLVANVSLLSPAAYSEKPVAPRRLLIMLMSVAGGVLAGVGLALLLEWQGQGIYSPRDLERIAPGTWLGSFPSHTNNFAPPAASRRPRFRSWLGSLQHSPRD
jgi:polysaccharide biosynthesis protein PslE